MGENGLSEVRNDTEDPNFTVHVSDHILYFLLEMLELSIGLFCMAAFHKITIGSTMQKPTIHQVTTMLATSKNVLFPGHSHLLTTGADDLTL